MPCLNKCNNVSNGSERENKQSREQLFLWKHTHTRHLHPLRRVLFLWPLNAETNKHTDTIFHTCSCWHAVPLTCVIGSGLLVARLSYARVKTVSQWEGSFPLRTTVTTSCPAELWVNTQAVKPSYTTGPQLKTQSKPRANFCQHLFKNYRYLGFKCNLTNYS